MRCRNDMLVPNGSGPPPDRHDFKEMFTLLDGGLEFTFRGQTQTVAAPMTVNIPANAPYAHAEGTKLISKRHAGIVLVKPLGFLDPHHFSRRTDASNRAKRSG